MKKLKIKAQFKSLFLSCKNMFFISSHENSDETFYLLKSPNNAKRLLTSIKDYEKGPGQERSLIE